MEATADNVHREAIAVPVLRGSAFDRKVPYGFVINLIMWVSIDERYRTRQARFTSYDRRDGPTKLALKRFLRRTRVVFFSGKRRRVHKD